MAYGPWEYAQEHPEYKEALEKKYEKDKAARAGIVCRFINSYDGSCGTDETIEICRRPAFAEHVNEGKHYPCDKWEPDTLKEYAFNANCQPEELGL